MASINFHLRDPQSTENTPIVLYLSYQGRRIKIATGSKIKPEHWEFDKQKCKNSYKKDPELNKINAGINESLESLSKRIQLLFTVYSNKGLSPTPEEIREAVSLKESTKEVNPETVFFQAFSTFLDAKAEIFERRTIQKYNTVIKSLQEFKNDTNYEITFQNMDQRFYDFYKKFLLNKKNSKHYKEQKVGMLNDTISKNIGAIKTFLKWSQESRYHNNDHYKKWEAKKKSKNEIVSLTEDELKKLYEMDFSNNQRLDRVRDIFCFAAFTGQRWSDIESFKKEHIIDDYWKFISKKTKKSIKIPLVGFSAPAKIILEKYQYKLPLISGQKFNKYLKEIGKEAKILEETSIRRFSGSKDFEIRKPKYEFMSSHMARRTFITILLENGVPPTTIMRLTGHSDLKTLMKYENTSDDAARLEFEKINILKKHERS